MKRLKSFLNKSKSGSADQRPSQPPTNTQPATPQPQPTSAHPHPGPPQGPAPPVESRPPPQQAPPPDSDPQPNPDIGFSSQTASGTLDIALVNQFPAGTTVYAIVSGRAIANDNALVLLRSDGRSTYFPSSPSGTMSPVEPNDIAIRLGDSGSTTTLTIPYIAGGRI